MTHHPQTFQKKTMERKVYSLRENSHSARLFHKLLGLVGIDLMHLGKTFTTYDRNTRSDLYVALPVLSQGKKWVLLYSTWRHVISLSTLYRRSNLCPGLSLLVVGDRKGAVFGGLVEAPLKPSTKKRYQGSNDTFVFTNTPGLPVIYRPTGVNRYFTLCSTEYLALGGGNHFALYLDSDLLNGSSLASETYGNSCLSHTQEFEVKEIELWGFVYASEYEEAISMLRTEAPGICRWFILPLILPGIKCLSLQGELCGWTCFYIGVAAVAFGCSYYHLKPNDGHLVCDRLPVDAKLKAAVEKEVGRIRGLVGLAFSTAQKVRDRRDHTDEVKVHHALLTWQLKLHHLHGSILLRVLHEAAIGVGGFVRGHGPLPVGAFSLKKRASTTTLWAKSWSKSLQQRSGTNQVYIDNLDPGVADEGLRSIFLQFGEIVYVKIPTAKGCRFVQFVNRTSAEEEIQRMHGSQIGQTIVHLSWGKSIATKQVIGVLSKES
ncbi:unnamed protein product [Lactuca saligna]|uniref:Oxidation resistance protein 1 n=1 Tax=Lactuca saligna TaxID=75948 RepID=A0AA35V7M9_LACSI|nr:unnamed protein product [Lactuca saligna]